MEDLNQRLEAAAMKRDRLEASCQRIGGRLEAARGSLRDIEAECQAKGIEPSQLDATILKLETRYREMVEHLEEELRVAESALAPFEALESTNSTANQGRSNP